MPPFYNQKTGFISNTANEHTFKADRVYYSGEIIQKFGRVGIIDGERRAQIGEAVCVKFNKTVEVEKADPNLAIAEGAGVGYVDITDAADPMKAVAGGAGTFDIGVATKASAAGEKFVEVIFPFGL